MQVLIVALMRATGEGFLATGLAIFLLLIIPWRAGDTWSLYAIPAVSLCMSLGTLSATLLVKTRTPGTPPVVLSASAVGLMIVGFILSII
ncbi:hypothetical protein [Myxosarcina sp. GI1(2024)]